MYLDWTRHLKDPEDKLKFENQVLAAKPVLERLRDLVEEKKTEIEKKEFDFNATNWTIKQASFLGSKVSLAWISKLVDLDQQRTINDR